MQAEQVPTASIIVPVYNKARYLKTALDSVFAQSYSNFELLAIDDGSTDDSVGILAAITDRRIRIFTQKNMGVSSARNRGVQLSRADIILFFDADDWMHEDYLQTQLRTMAEHPERAFFATTFKRFSADEISPRPGSPGPDKPVVVIDDLPAAWRKGQTFITSCVAVRRGALMAQPSLFPVGESFGEDMDLWLRLAEKHALVLLPCPLVGYRENAADSLTSMKPTTTLPTYISRLEIRARTFPAGSPVRRSTLNYVADAHISLARHLLAQGQRMKCLQTLLARLPQGFCRPRWWVTLFMSALVPRGAVLAWEQYRIGRTQKRA
jgi:glycosyltransferase involved in cell wall biosynthesis